jgi:S-adenosyl-L-methionine hydrolase (adenosine-forming)
MPVITLLTDFGTADTYVGVMKGVIAGIAPEAQVIDLTHEVPPQDVRTGAFHLLCAFPYFPAGTIHVAVVDPGVGTDRKIVAVKAGQHTFVGPDNGLLRWAVDAAGGADQCVSVEAPDVRLPAVSTTFHGRDVMAPAAAHLARGLPLDALGPVHERLIGEQFPVPTEIADSVQGEVLLVDRFGNCITNIRHSPEGCRIAVDGHNAVPVRTYGDARRGTIVALTGSSGFLEVSVVQGSAAAELGISRGASVHLTR